MDTKKIIEQACSSKTDECIDWPLSKDRNGYGWANLFGLKRAHRVAYLMKHGEFDRSKHVLHKCDNPSCINPNHLFLGSHAENMRDMRDKGRGGNSLPQNAGETHPKARLTNETVAKIREQFGTGKTTKTALAAIYGVAHQTICDAINGITWKTAK